MSAVDPPHAVHPTSIRDIVARVRNARDRGLKLAVRSTGLGASSTVGGEEGVVLIDVSALRGVDLDQAGRVVRCQAGTRWADVIGRASAAGFAVHHDLNPATGVVGHLLDGGVGWYARKFGLGTNHVTAIEVVDGRAEVIRATHDDHAELFWALRGGRVPLGVVTSIEQRVVPVTSVYAGALVFPWERVNGVLAGWRALVRGFIDEVTSMVRLVRLPDTLAVPASMRGQTAVVIEAAYLGSCAGGEALLRPLRELGPALDTFRLRNPAGVAGVPTEHGAAAARVAGRWFLGDLPSAGLEAVAALSAAAGSPESSPPPAPALEIRHTGGALARSASHHGARDTLAGVFCVTAYGQAGPDDPLVSAITELLAPHRVGDPTHRDDLPFDATPSTANERARRLAAVKATHDPLGLFQTRDSSA